MLSRYSKSLLAGPFWDRIPWGGGGARFSAPVQTGPGAHPTYCTMGTGSFQGVKRPGRGVDHPPPSKRRGHERVGLYLYSPSGPQWPVMGGTLPLPYVWAFLSYWSFVTADCQSCVVYPDISDREFLRGVKSLRCEFLVFHVARVFVLLWDVTPHN